MIKEKLKYLQNLPNHTQDDVFPLLHDQRRGNGNDHASDLGCTLYGQTEVFLNLENIQGLFGVYELRFNCTRHRMVDHFTKMMGLNENLKIGLPKQNSIAHCVKELH